MTPEAAVKALEWAKKEFKKGRIVINFDKRADTLQELNRVLSAFLDKEVRIKKALAYYKYYNNNYIGELNNSSNKTAYSIFYVIGLLDAIEKEPERLLNKAKKKFLSNTATVFFNTEKDSLVDLNKVLSFFLNREIKVRTSGFSYFEVNGNTFRKYNGVNKNSHLYTIPYLIKLMGKTKDTENLQTMAPTKILCVRSKTKEGIITRDTFEKNFAHAYPIVDETDCAYYIINYKGVKRPVFKSEANDNKASYRVLRKPSMLVTNNCDGEYNNELVNAVLHKNPDYTARRLKLNKFELYCEEPKETIYEIKELFRNSEIAIENDLKDKSDINYILEYFLPEDVIKSSGESNFYFVGGTSTKKVWCYASYLPEEIKRSIKASEIIQLSKEHYGSKLKEHPVTPSEAIDPRDYLADLLSKPEEIESNKTKIDPPELKVFKIPSIKL